MADLDWGEAVDLTELTLDGVESRKEYFPYDPDVTDFTLVVQKKELHVAKVVLIDASPVFKKLLTKNTCTSKLEIQEKNYSSFETFLRCIYPRKYTLTVLSVDDILPLAAEYEVESVLQKCEDVLLTELEFKIAKVSPHHVNVDGDVKYLMKCLYCGEKYSLQELYRRSFEMAQPYKLRRYIQNEHYQMLPDKNKRELLESRLLKIEDDVGGHYYGNSSTSIRTPQITYRGATSDFSQVKIQCSSTLFQ